VPLNYCYLKHCIILYLYPSNIQTVCDTQCISNCLNYYPLRYSHVLSNYLTYYPSRYSMYFYLFDLQSFEILCLFCTCLTYYPSRYSVHSLMVWPAVLQDTQFVLMLIVFYTSKYSSKKKLFSFSKVLAVA